MRLDQLPLRRPGRIASVDWAGLGDAQAKRLREMGVDDGVEVEALHRAALLGPIACRIGRMVVALRRGQAAAVRVEFA